MPPARIVFYLATLGGILFAARVVLDVGHPMHGPPPLWLAVLAISAYVALLVAGVLFLRLRMFADAIVRGPEDARGVALTFDGLEPKRLREVLGALDAHGVKATFFVLGRDAEEHRDVVEDIARRGHGVGVEGYARDPLFFLRGPRRVRRDLERALRSVEAVTKERPTLLRPSRGRTTPTIARIAEQLELVVVAWSRDRDDGAIVRVRAEDDAALRVALGLKVSPLADWLEADER